jgi:hypothetical protein
MNIVIILIIVAVILAAMVYVLHRNQQNEKTEAADRANPLPPLERSLVAHVDSGEDDNEEFQLTPPKQRVKASADKPQVKSSQTSAEASKAPAAAAPNKDWQLACKNLRDEHQYDEALELCKRNLPQLNAFRQACLVIRAKIRSERANGDPVIEPSLVQLHRMAASAAFFHEKNPQLPAPLSSTLLKSLANSQWESIVSDYTLVGYEHLSLLTATDQKMLVAAFGEPPEHAHMREFNSQVWQELQA